MGGIYSRATKFMSLAQYYTKEKSKRRLSVLRCQKIHRVCEDRSGHRLPISRDATFLLCYSRILVHFSLLCLLSPICPSPTPPLPSPYYSSKDMIYTVTELHVADQGSEFGGYG